MAIDFGSANTTNYLSAGVGADALACNTLGIYPVTCAFLVYPYTVTAWSGIISQGDGNTGASHRDIEITNTGNVQVGEGTTFQNSSWTLTANRWQTVVVVFRATAAKDLYCYDHTTNTLSVSTVVANTNVGPAANTQLTVIGAWDGGGTVGDFASVRLGWLAAWTADFGLANGSSASLAAPLVWHLIRSGPWHLLRRPDCRTAVVFTQSLAARDIVVPGRVWSPVGSPTWAGVALTEAPPPDILPILQPGSGAITGTANLTQAAQTLTASGTVAITGTANLTQAAQTLTASSSGTITGTATLTQTAQTTTANGTVTVTGTANLTQAAQTLSATGGSSVATNWTISVGAGYTDVSPKQLVRLSTNRLYIAASNCDSYPCDAASQTLRMYRANSTGVPSGFTRQDSTNEPTGVAQWAIASDANDLIHVVYTRRTTNGGNITALRYVTFNTSSNTWGTPEDVDTGPFNYSSGQGDQSVSLALDANGKPHVVYLKSDGTRRRMYYRNKVSGTWSTAELVDDQTFGTNEKIWHPNIIFDAAGRRVFAWLKGTFNDTADGTIYVRVRDTNDTWGTTKNVSGTGAALTSIDQSTSLLATANGRYHITWINASTTPGNKYIRYAYSDDLNATWTRNDPGGGTQATHNPSIGYANGKVRIFGHGTPDAGNHGVNLYYFEGNGGSAAWGSWTQFVTGTNFDSSVNVRWSQYCNWYPNTWDVAYWDDTYPNNLYAGTSIALADSVGTATLTQAAQTLTASGAVAVTGTANLTQAAQTVAAGGTVAVTGTSALTHAGQTLAAGGTVAVTGTATLTQAAQTATANGTVAITGSATLTQAAQTLTANGTVGTASITGSATLTQAAQTLTAGGTVVIVGSATIVQAAQIVVGTGYLSSLLAVPPGRRIVAPVESRRIETPVAE